MLIMAITFPKRNIVTVSVMTDLIDYNTSATVWKMLCMKSGPAGLFIFNTMQRIELGSSQSYRTICLCRRLFHIISVGKLKAAKGFRVKLQCVWKAVQ